MTTDNSTDIMQPEESNGKEYPSTGATDVVADEREDLQSVIDLILITTGIEPIEFVGEAVRGVSNSLKAIAETFEENLLASYLTAAATWVLARNTASRAMYNMMMGVKIGVETGFPAHLRKSYEERIKSLDASLETPEWKTRFKENSEMLARSNLSAFLKNEFGQEAAANVLRQCTVLIWGTLEVLASDLFVYLLNRKSKLTSSLLKDERTKKLFSHKDIAGSLAAHDYDLSQKMGTVLLEQCRMDDLETIRVVFDVILGQGDLRRLLQADDLWKLYKIRNLIVHRAGIVDELFTNTSGITIPIGQRLRITAKQFEAYLIMVGRVGVAMLSAASKTIDS